MGTPTQVTGLASETPALAATTGFLGWSPEVDRSVHSVIGGVVYKGAWATSTAYNVGDVVSYNGTTFAALVAIPSSNTTPPAAGASWRDSNQHRASVGSPTTRVTSNYR